MRSAHRSSSSPRKLSWECYKIMRLSQTEFKENKPQWSIDVPFHTLHGVHNCLLAAFDVVLGCYVVHDDDHEMADSTFQLLDPFFNSRCVLKVVQSPASFPCIGGTRKDEPRRVLSSIIFNATPIVSCSNGTGITFDATGSSVRTCFPLAVMYSVVLGTLVRLFPDDVYGHEIVR